MEGRVKSKLFDYSLDEDIQFPYYLYFPYHQDRRCTLSFKAAGSRKCGKNKFSNEASALNAGCHEYYNRYIRPYNSLTVKMHKQSGHQLATLYIKDIPWDQGYEDYSVTGDVWDKEKYAFVAFVSQGQIISNEPVGNYIDDVEVTCCCLELYDYYIGKYVGGKQGYTRDELGCPREKSNPHSIERKPPNFNYYNAYYNNHHSEPQVYSLGFGGHAVYKFDSGIYESLIIYEETLIKCHYGYGCYYYDYHEDAQVEVSIDGVNYVTVRESLKNDWILITGRRALNDENQNISLLEDDSLARGSGEGDYYDQDIQRSSFERTSRTARTYFSIKRKIRKAVIWLPKNNACYKYVKITDKSDKTKNTADDGFDLHAIKGGKLCCNAHDNDHLYDDDDDDDGTVTQQFITVSQPLSSAAIPMFAIALVGTLTLVALVVVQVRKQRRRRHDETEEALEVEAKQMDAALEDASFGFLPESNALGVGRPSI